MMLLARSPTMVAQLSNVSVSVLSWRACFCNRRLRLCGSTSYAKDARRTLRDGRPHAPGKQANLSGGGSHRVPYLLEARQIRLRPKRTLFAELQRACAQLQCIWVQSCTSSRTHFPVFGVRFQAAVQKQWPHHRSHYALHASSGCVA